MYLRREEEDPRGNQSKPLNIKSEADAVESKAKKFLELSGSLEHKRNLA